VLDVQFVKDDTLEHIIERVVVLLQVNVVVYTHLKANLQELLKSTFSISRDLISCCHYQYVLI
jgi:hypothetical protein